MASSTEIQTLRAMIRGAGLRITPSRLAVLALLRESDAPLSHGEVVKRISSEQWDPATLYRNLTDFVEAKLARRTELGDHVWRFELAPDDHPTDHPHFVCTKCGAIECLADSQLLFTQVKSPRAIRRREIEVQVRGRCDVCA